MRRFPLLLGILIVAAVAQADDVSIVRQQFVGYYTAAQADRGAARMQRALSDLEHHTRHLTNPELLHSDGSFSDIDYSGVPDGAWGPWDHTRRLIVMAKAWATPGQQLYRDPRLLAQIDAALAYTMTFYGPERLPEGNWWFWTIGIPIDLGPTLVLVDGAADPQIVAALTRAIALRIGSSPSSRGISGPVPVGQNLVWSAFTHMTVALLQNDPSRLESVREAMTRVAQPGSGDGMKADFSFHQHGRQLYTGGYGGAFANDVARYALIANGTRYGLATSSLHAFAAYVAEGIAWSMYGDYFDVSVVGREVARPSTTAYNGVAALVQSAWIDSPRADEIRSAAAKVLESWNGTMPTELAGLAARVEDAQFAAVWPSGYRHYFASDYSVHRRAGWFASVKMFSSRTKSGESTNSENLLGARQSDGRFYLVLRGNEYFGRNVWPAFDWTRVPGTTVEQNPRAASADYGYGLRSFAGGTGNGTNGVSAMEVAPLRTQLSARKAWFFFDDAIVFLTNSVRSLAPYAVETIVNQWPLLDERSRVTSGADWATLEGVGYWFPLQMPKIVRETRSGTWAALGGTPDSTPYSRTFVTMLFEHGNLPMNASAAYAIVPGATPESMRAWAGSRPIAILANDARVSAARDLRSGDVGITFWRDASINGIASDSAAVVYVSGDSRTMRLDVADPHAASSGTIELTVPGRWLTKDVVTITHARATTLRIPKKGGRAITIVLERIQPRRRAAR